jgi:hypothetical protein
LKVGVQSSREATRKKPVLLGRISTIESGTSIQIIAVIAISDEGIDHIG